MVRFGQVLFAYNEDNPKTSQRLLGYLVTEQPIKPGKKYKVRIYPSGATYYHFGKFKVDSVSRNGSNYMVTMVRKKVLRQRFIALYA